MASRRVSWHGKIVEPLYRWKLSSPSWLKRYSFLGERAISSLAATDGGSYEENKLCPTCTKVISRVQAILQQPDAQIRAHREEIPYHFSIRKFLRSADGGCHLCSLFLGATWLEGRVKYSEARDHIMKNHAARKGKLKVELSGVGERTEWNSAYSPENALMKIDVSYLGSGIIHVVRNRSSQSEALQDDVPRQPLCASTGDFEAMHLASYWLKRCLQHHSVCDQAMRNTTKVRPCRLLRVRGEDGNEELNLIRLGEDQEDVQYLALSYSWGPQSANCVRLLISNIDAFCQEIDESTLPLTIRDAVKVTRSLGYQFLWVDSLCIIQDSREDWDSEAVKMGYIYRNAVLTIAGLGCSGNHESLFRNRNPLCDRPCGVPDTADVQISNTAHFFNREYELYGATAAPLHTRAWVVQERISSLRTLFFGESGMFWECAGCLACESDPQGTLEGDAVNFKHTINDVLNPSSDESTRYFAFRTLWKLVLEQYTSCNLTKQTDKLNAIKGVMQLLSEGTGYDYYQGLWLDILLIDLCWRTNDVTFLEDPKKSGRLGNGVPSWSWASLKQSVSSNLYIGKYSLADASSGLCPSIVGYPFSKEAPEFEDRGLPPSIAAALTGRPEDSISLMTQFTKVYLTHRTREYMEGAGLTLEEPPEQQIRGPLPDGTRAELQHRHRFVSEYEWFPDEPIDPQMATAWFINILNFESRDGRKTGVIGLVAVDEDLSRRRFRRIGILKKKVFTSEEECNHYGTDVNGNSVKDPSSLPPNPFAMKPGLKQLVHLV